jgi:hypothetical protein
MYRLFLSSITAGRDRAGQQNKEDIGPVKFIMIGGGL